MFWLLTNTESLTLSILSTYASVHCKDHFKNTFLWPSPRVAQAYGYKNKYLEGKQLVLLFSKFVLRFLKRKERNLKIELSYDPAVSPLEVYSAGFTPYSSYTHTFMFFPALFTIASKWNIFCCLWTDEWERKMWHKHTMEC